MTVSKITNNRYRLVAYLSFRTQIPYVKHILTHREYDKGHWNQ
jgi:mRNA interferase HigB